MLLRRSFWALTPARLPGLSALLVLTGVLVLLAPSSAWAGYEGDYAESKWTLRAYAGDGSVEFDSDTLVLDSGSTGSQTLAQSDVVVRAVKSGTVTFSWAYYGSTATGYKFSWLRNASVTTLSSRQFYDEGTSSFTVMAGDTFGFRVTAPKNDLSGIAEISTFFAAGQEPAIVLPPQTQSGCLGQFVIFDVLATNAMEYQWQFKGVDLLYEDQDFLLVEATPPADSGNYRVIVRNPLGSVTSRAVQLVIRQPPAITLQPAASVARCAGQSVTLSASASGTALAYQWQRNGTNLPGATSSSFTLSNLTVAHSGQYVLTASNECGRAFSNPLWLAVSTPPSIGTSPQSQTRGGGQSVTFEVTANGPEPWQFQWRRNGTNLFNGTNSTLTLSNLQNSDAGGYSVRVANDCGSVTSAVATLTVNPADIGLRIVRGPNRSVAIEVLAATGRYYVLETSTNLANWVPTGTNLLVTSGSVLFQDQAESQSRFYRVRPLSP